MKDKDNQKQRLALLINIIAPYRLPIYKALSEAFDMAIFTGEPESNRGKWEGVHNQLQAAKIKKSFGVVLKLPRMKAGRFFDFQYIQVTPGYLKDLISFKPGIIISNEMGIRTLSALIYGTLKGVPVIVWWGGTLYTEGNIGVFRKIARTLIAKWAKHWISYGETSTDYLLSLGIKRRAITQIQNCIDESLFQRHSEPMFHLTPKPVFLYVGQFIGRKGVFMLLKSAHRMQRQGYDFSLLLVGDGPDKNQLLELSNSLGLRSTHFVNGQKPEMMPQVYKSADYLIFPTLEDSWGLVVNEALWSGLSVISSIYAGCTKEIIPEPNQFDPLDPENFDEVFRLALEGNLSPDKATLLPSQKVASLILNSIDHIAKSDKQSTNK